MTTLARLKPVVNTALRPLGFKIDKLHDFGDTANFIPFAETRAKAKAAGLSIGDYVDSVMNGVPDGSRNAVRMMSEWGALSRDTKRILEIGPGTGRYLEKTIGKRPPADYEIYETAAPWASYLVEAFGVRRRRTDGYALGETPDASVDLVQAHKVFNTIPAMATMCYWRESARVLRPGGWMVFDIVTEDCLAPETVDRWAGSGVRNSTYPTPFPLRSATDYFAAKGFDLAGKYRFAMGVGFSELLAFRRR